MISISAIPDVPAFEYEKINSLVNHIVCFIKMKLGKQHTILKKSLTILNYDLITAVIHIPQLSELFLSGNQSEHDLSLIHI